MQGYYLPGLVERARSVIDSDDRALRAAARKLVGLEYAEVTAPREGSPFADVSLATFGQPFDMGRPAVVWHTPGGKSPFEVHDLAGNVWEWCRDVRR